MPQLNLPFDPILLPGQTARLFRTESNFVDVRVIAIGPLGVHRHDFGTLTSSENLDNDCTHIDMQEGEMAQYRYIPRGNFEVHLQHPAGVDQYRTQGTVKSTRTSAFRMQPWADDPDVPQIVQDAYWRLSEFIVLEDKTPRFDLYPIGHPSGGVEAHVDFFGIKYSLAPLLEVDKPGRVDIWVDGWPAGKKIGSL